MLNRSKLIATFGAIACIFTIGAAAHAESYSFGAYENGRWVTNFGEVPAPASNYQVPTASHDLNDVDKAYLCELVQVSTSDCANVNFATGASGMNGSAGITQFILNVSLSYKGKSCSGAVWKTYQADGTWMLSSPTAVFGFPHTCDIP